MKGSGWVWIIVAGLLALLAGGLAVSTLPPGSVPDVVQQFADAIAQAEGFYVAGSRPQRNNNPGDLTDSSGSFRVFSTIEEGWAALYDQVYKMFYGGSAYYQPSMTIAQVSYYYANGSKDPTGAASWASNVAAYLGVTTDTTLNALMGSSS